MLSAQEEPALGSCAGWLRMGASSPFCVWALGVRGTLTGLSDWRILSLLLSLRVGMGKHSCAQGEKVSGKWLM